MEKVKKAEKVPFTQKMKERLMKMATAYDKELKAYLQACHDGMDLEGEYGADLKELAFVKKETAEKGAA